MCVTQHMHKYIYTFYSFIGGNIGLVLSVGIVVCRELHLRSYNNGGRKGVGLGHGFAKLALEH